MCRVNNSAAGIARSGTGASAVPVPLVLRRAAPGRGGRGGRGGRRRGRRRGGCGRARCGADHPDVQRLGGGPPRARAAAAAVPVAPGAVPGGRGAGAVAGGRGAGAVAGEPGVPSAVLEVVAAAPSGGAASGAVTSSCSVARSVAWSRPGPAASGPDLLAAGCRAAPERRGRQAAVRRAWGRDRFPLPWSHPRGSRSPMSRELSVASGLYVPVGERRRNFSQPFQDGPPGGPLYPRKAVCHPPGRP